jgi:predicted ATPase/transcriptional regulator with XRE-family HTH domain
VVVTVETSFGRWLQRRRKALDLTQEELAQRVGCAAETLRKIEADVRRPSRQIAERLAQALEIQEADRAAFIKAARTELAVDRLAHPTQDLPQIALIPPKTLSSEEVPFLFTQITSPSSNKPITNLPAPLTSFIGREKELEQIKKRLEKNRLVTLTGSGGVGKTRLSIKVGEKVLENYADGAWLVELAPILDPMLVPRATAIAIGLRDEPQRPVIDMLSDYLLTKKILVILDNCEHVLDAGAQLADTLLKRCPGLKILGTSREALGILGEAVYPVASLELPDLQEWIDKFRDYESIRLFEERAQLTRTDFLLTIENAPSVAKICNRLDGIPLAIELAAARVSTFSIEQIAARLQENFSLLTTGNRTALPRHQTLQDAIDWSYDLLSATEKTLFLRLSVFINGWTLEAAENVCSDTYIKSTMIADLLSQLVNKSLVIIEETQSGTRYRMLETIRQYAYEKLAESEGSDVLHDRHLDYFLGLAERAEPYLMKSEQLEWLAVLDADYENLRLALEWSLAKPTAESSLNLCRALWWFWIIRCYWMEGLHWVRKALAKPFRDESKSEKIARARALYTQAYLEWQLGDFEQMLPPAQASFELAQEVADARVIAIARFHLGAVWLKNDPEKGSSFIQQSFAEFQSLHEVFWQALSFLIVSRLLIEEGKLTNVAGALKSLELARRTGERLTIGDALSYCANWLFRIGRVDEGRALLDEAEISYKQLGYRGPTDNFLALAQDAWLRGETQKARMIYTEIHQHSSLLGEKIGNAFSIAMLGLLAMDEGNLQEAETYLQQAVALARETGQKPDLALYLIELSNLYYRQGNLEDFRHCVREGLALRNSFFNSLSAHILVKILRSLRLKNAESSARILGLINKTEIEEELLLGRLSKRDYGLYETYLRQQLGDATFNTLFAEGQKMSLDEGLDLALKTVEGI